MDERSQQPVSQRVATVAQDEAFQWAGYCLKQCKHGAFSHNTCVMNRPRPSHDSVHDTGISVADQLNVYGMIVLSVHIFVFVHCRRSDLYMCAIHTTDDIRKIRYRMKHDFHDFRLSLFVEANVSWQQSSECCSHSVDGSTHCCFADTK